LEIANDLKGIIEVDFAEESKVNDRPNQFTKEIK
jgi:hypothetical protein